MCRKPLVMLLAVFMLSACRGSDETDISRSTFPQTPDPNAFASFLNKQPGVPKDTDGTEAVHNVDDFPEAYYNTIDPDGTRDSFTKWRIANGFLNPDGSMAECDPASCVQSHVKFRDTKDLGYGRNMFMRWNTLTDEVAVYVENFQVDVVPGVPYGPLNFEALVNDDRQWNFGVNAIEFSAFPYTGAGARLFTKFYNFAGDGKRALDPAGTLQHRVDLDNRGAKPMPGACIVCHGGRGRTVVYVDSDGKKKLAPTLAGGIAGDVQAHLQMLELDTFQDANAPGFTKEENREGIRLINQAVLASYEYREQRFTGNGDWNPEFAINLLKRRYGGDPGVENSAYDAEVVPDAWSSNQDVYRKLVGPNCIVCHALRGTRDNDQMILPSLAQFQNLTERIDHLVFEQGKMPLGLLNYTDFWESDDKDPGAIATALGLSNRLVNGKAIRPGAPVATIAAPPVATGINSATGSPIDIAISGAGSAFAIDGSYRWEVSPAQSASVLTTGLDGSAVLRANVAQTLTLTLSVEGIHGGTSTASQSIRVLASDDPEAPVPGPDIRYFGANGIDEWIRDQAGGNCLICHDPAVRTSMPIHFSACQSEQINGYEFLYRSVLARVNFDSPLDSLFLRKPSNGATRGNNRGESEAINYHSGGNLLRDDKDYSAFLSWILHGAPAGDIPAPETIDPSADSCTS